MDLNREKELKFKHADCKSKLGQKLRERQQYKTRRYDSKGHENNDQQQQQWTLYLERNQPGKFGFEVGRHLSLFNLIKPSSLERVGDMVSIQKKFAKD